MAKSIFRYGFEWIRRQLVNPIDRRQAIELIRFLVPGKPPVQVPRPKRMNESVWARYVDGAIGSTLQIGSTP